MLTTEFKGKELRESKRYKYFGTIELTQIPSGAAVSGHIFNISTGGCLIKAIRGLSWLNGMRCLLGR